MEPSVKKVPNKKVFFGALGIFAVILIFVLISIFTVNPAKLQNSSKISSQNDSATPSNLNRTSFPTDTMEGKKDWKVYKNTQFTISYPADWQTEELIFPNGETGTTFHPTIVTTKSPSMLITGTAGTSTSMQQKQQNYTSLGFKSSNTLIDNNQAVKLSGTIPERKATDTNSNAIEVSHIYIRKGNTDYLLKYSYLDKASNPDFESLFGKMITSFKFN